MADETRLVPTRSPVRRRDAPCSRNWSVPRLEEASATPRILAPRRKPPLRPCHRRLPIACRSVEPAVRARVSRGRRFTPRTHAPRSGESSRSFENAQEDQIACARCCGVIVSNLVTDPLRRALMQRVRQARTPAENEVARVCRELGISYRRNVKSLPGTPDIANKSRRWAIFVNGCFWHRHKGCKKATVPKRNQEFWISKFEVNRRRDARKIRELRALGYDVLLVWECETASRPELAARLSALPTTCRSSSHYASSSSSSGSSSSS